MRGATLETRVCGRKIKREANNEAYVRKSDDKNSPAGKS
jgi:hypothetical protein